MVPADSRRISRVPRYSGYHCGTYRFAYGALTLCGATFQMLPLAIPCPTLVVLLPQTGRNPTGLGSSPVARHYWGNHCCFLLLRVLRCFSSPRSPPYSKARIAGLQPAGLSHSDIRGSEVICTFPRLFAAYHVLHRLWEPRHPPYALFYFLAFAFQLSILSVLSSILQWIPRFLL